LLRPSQQARGNSPETSPKVDKFNTLTRYQKKDKLMVMLLFA